MRTMARASWRMRMPRALPSKRLKRSLRGAATSFVVLEHDSGNEVRRGGADAAGVTLPCSYGATSVGMPTCPNGGFRTFRT